MAQKHVLISRLNDPASAKPWPSKRTDVGEDQEEEVVEVEMPLPVPKPRKPISGRTKPAKAVQPKPEPKPSLVSPLVTAIIVNFKTKVLLRRAYSSFRKFYPRMEVVIVDNGSKDGSTDMARRLGSRRNTTVIIMDHNVGHGPAMGKALKAVDSPYAFLLDTDTETVKGGFVEAMVKAMKEDDRLYAIGWKRWVDKVSGVPKEWHLDRPPPKKFTAYVHPSAALIRVAMYHSLPPFFHHGAPCLNNMREAERRKLKVASFPIRDYVKHLKAGTRRMYDGRWDPTERTPKREWQANKDYPI